MSLHCPHSVAYPLPHCGDQPPPLLLYPIPHPCHPDPRRPGGSFPTCCVPAAPETHPLFWPPPQTPPPFTLSNSWALLAMRTYPCPLLLPCHSNKNPLNRKYWTVSLIKIARPAQVGEGSGEKPKAGESISPDLGAFTGRLGTHMPLIMPHGVSAG